MSQNFSVNGKEYVSSSTIAASSGYTSDYIGRLAREGKILGSLVGRQWFIEPESLKVFIAQATIEKEIRKEALSVERKLAQKVQPQKESQVTLPSLSVQVLAQTLVVLFCGLFVGGLSWIIAVEKIGTDEIVQGAEQSVRFVVESTVPTKKIITSGVDSKTSVAASSESLSSITSNASYEKVIFTALPIFPPREVIASSSSTPSSSGILESLEFSDEVRISVDDLGNQYIEPVFRSRATNTRPVRFLLVPADGREN